MLDLHCVLQYFGLFADLSGAELLRWRGLCEGAAAQLCGRLRKPADSLDGGDMDRLYQAAAACAYHSYAVLQASSAQEEVRVGDISLRSAASGASDGTAREVREHFLAQASDLLEPECFVFRQAVPS